MGVNTRGGNMIEIFLEANLELQMIILGGGVCLVIAMLNQSK